MPTQCTGNLSSVWQLFESTPDPYAFPDRGFCSEKQLTQQAFLLYIPVYLITNSIVIMALQYQGHEHAVRYGEILRSQFVNQTGLLEESCSPHSLMIACSTEQKNQATLQAEF